ncbi:hypothetical protein ACPPVW_18405 [Leifsonia sp. McL0607]|uniref:hypothetical protein n=1 Tax=Leifsonia sp. McL0607 TaxID=3415672 RepID=UPI003CFB4EE2
MLQDSQDLPTRIRATSAARHELNLVVPFGRLPDLLAELAGIDVDLGSALPDTLHELASSVTSATLAMPELRESATGAIAYELDALLKYSP